MLGTTGNSWSIITSLQDLMFIPSLITEALTGRTRSFDPDYDRIVSMSESLLFP
jgi:hypothetical protein